MLYESEIERRKGRRALVALIGLVLLIPLAIAVISYRLYMRQTEIAPPVLPALAATPAVAPTVALAPTAKPRADLPALDASDEFVRKLAEALSSNPAWTRWLVNDRLVRRFVASVDNVAEGRSPNAHLGFLASKDPFKVDERGSEARIDPATYRRYETTADVVASLDAKGCAELYQETRPLFQNAYKELGYPDRNFDDTLARAIRRLLDTPEAGANVELRSAVKSWKLADPRLEELTPVQKQFLRMGPENVAKVKRKLREIAEALELRV